ncbi:MAG: retropepsin-like aspartic protease [bacterium]|nr:retropepsin-like aspartic protease [bacterium]
MAVIEKTIKLRGSIGEADENALFDSGSTYSCIQPALAKKLAHLEPLPEVMKFGTAGEGYELEAKEAIRLNFYLNGDRFSDEFMVIEGLSDKVIIGAASLQKWRMKLDFEHDEVLYDPKVTKLRIV